MDVEELIKTADELRHMGQYEEALNSYDTALDTLKTCSNSLENEQKALALIGKGLALWNLKRCDDALSTLNESIEILSTLNKSIEIDSKLTKAWNTKGLILRNLKRYDYALEAFDTSIYIDQDNAFSWNGKGLVLLSLQKYTEALEAYKTALNKNESKRKPDIKELTFSLNGKGVAFASLGQFDKSIEAFNESLKLDDPKPAFALSGEATVYYSIGKLEEALNLFEDSLKFDPTSSFAWDGKGLVLLSLKQFDTAIESFKKSISYDCDFIPAYNNLTELYLDIGDLKNASSISDDVFFKDAINDSTLYLKGGIELEKQNYDNAIHYFKEAIALSPGSPLILFWEVYAKYLKAEVSFDPNDKKYQDLILSCIRELEKISTFNSLNIKTEHINYRLLTKVASKFRRHKLRYNILRIETYNNYFLGCFYYKLGDYFSAKDKFINCITFNFEPKVTNSAEQLLEDIWNHKIYTSIPKWWLESPYHSFRRKITFLFLIFSIFGLLLPESSFLFLLILYNYTTKILMLSQPIYELLNSILPTKILMLSQPIYELLNSILLIVFSLLVTALSFIDWKDNTTQYAFLFILLFFFLVYPCLKSLKGSEIEIELQSPQNFELTPGLIERNLKDFEKDLKDELNWIIF